MRLENHRYNHIGGIDADRILDSGEIVPYTLTEQDIEDIPGGAEIAPYVPPTAAPPASITMRQCRLQLLAIGLLDDVDAAIAAIPAATARRAAQIEWEYAAAVERQSQWVLTLAAALGLTESQLDRLFIGAAAL